MSKPVYLSTSEVLARIPHKKSWLWAAIKAGRFPEPVRIGGRRYWTESQLDDYDAQLMAEAQARQAEKVAASQARAA